MKSSTVSKHQLTIRLIRDHRIPDDNTAMYLLATAGHETGYKYYPVKEKYNGTRYEYFENLYGYQTKLGKSLGNTKIGDGALYAGRGLVQITGKDNHYRFGKALGIDLVKFPEEAMKDYVAYEILVRGCIGIDGLFFRSDKGGPINLSRYINSEISDLVNARNVIIYMTKHQQKVAKEIAADQIKEFNSLHSLTPPYKLES